MSCVRCRAPPLPRGRGALLAVFWTPASTAAFQRPTLYPRKASIAGAWRHEAYGVHLIHPSGLPLSCRRWMDHRLLGFLPVLRTPQCSRLRRTPRAGTGAEHSPGTTRRSSRPSIPDSSLTMCDLVSQPDPPVIGGALEHQPLDTLAPQVIHQRDHRRVGGIHLPHRLPLAVRPALPAPGCTPSPTPWRHRSRPRTSPPRRAPRPPPRRHRRPRHPAWCPLPVQPPLPRLHREPAGSRLPGGRRGKSRI